MRAIVCPRYGGPDVLELREVERPGKDAYVSIDDGALKLDSARLAAMKELVEAGHSRPALDRCYPLEDIAEAHRYVEQGHKRGGVAVTVGRSQD
jgi:NADPH:quinone reductase-like Zn-dependent oxidoreductase